MAGLVLKDVTKRFEKSLVLDRVSLELGDGELLVLLGPSGCGKSTLLRIIAGLEEADEGEVFIGPRRVDHLRPRERDVALVFQNYSLYPHMTVAGNLAFPLRVAGVTKSERVERVRRVAAMLGLEDRLDDRPGQLSGGQRQRVALGRAIIREPAIFLLDEPLSNLDADLRVRMRREIVRLQRELDKTMVHVTHDQAEALTMADRIVLLHEGHIQQIGTPDQLYDTPANLFVARFIGTPKINTLPGRVENGRLIPFGIPVVRELATDRDVMIGLRPEAIFLGTDGDYSAEIASTEYQGDQYVVSIRFRDHTLLVSKVSDPIEPGRQVRFSLDTRRLRLFDPVSGSVL